MPFVSINVKTLCMSSMKVCDVFWGCFLIAYKQSEVPSGISNRLLNECMNLLFALHFILELRDLDVRNKWGNGIYILHTFNSCVCFNFNEIVFVLIPLLRRSRHWVVDGTNRGTMVNTAPSFILDQNKNHCRYVRWLWQPLVA